MENHFGILDYIAVIVTLVLTAIIGLYFSRTNKSNNDLLLGGRAINHWPVALSMMATYMSAVTIIGLPAEVFGYGIEIFNMTIIYMFCFPLSIAVFASFLHSLKLTSIFEYLDLRYECPSLRKLVSGVYIFEQVAFSGMVLYGPSLVLVTFLGIPTWMSIIGIGVLCTLYTCVGGIKAVVWTDALQAIIMMAGMFAIMLKAIGNSGGISRAFEIAQENGRLDIFQIRLNIFERHNFFNFYIGFTFYMFYRASLHQPQFQRLSTQRTLTDAKKALFLSMPFTFIVNALSVMTGLAVFAIYYTCDPVKSSKVKTIDHIVPYFVVTEMKHIPGILGLFVACIFSGVLSTISSTLNSLTAVTWEDFLSKVPTFAKMDSQGQANVSRVTGLVYGILSGGLAFSAQYMGSVYSASFKIVGASSGVIAGTFVCGFFIRSINATGVKFGVVVAYATMLGIGVGSLFTPNLNPVLPTSTENCDGAVTNFTVNATTTETFEVESALGIFQLSYLWYSLVGAIITVTVATVCMGLFVACIFSGVLSSISSTLNSLTAVTWEDILSKVPTFAKMDNRRQANVSRVTGLVYGIVSVGLAFSAEYMGSVYSASFKVAGATEGVLLAVFLSGFFIPQINARGIKVGALVGCSTMAMIVVPSLFMDNLNPTSRSTTTTNNCDFETLSNFNSTAQSPSLKEFEIELPEKLFTLSYLMYPLVGAVVTVTVATVVSFWTGGFQNAKMIPPKYLHPFVRSQGSASVQKLNGTESKKPADCNNCLEMCSL